MLEVSSNEKNYMNYLKQKNLRTLLVSKLGHGGQNGISHEED